MTRRLLWLTMVAAGLLAGKGTPTLAVEAAPAPYLYSPASCMSAPYPDVGSGHPLCAWIQRLKLDQITDGCGAGNFCPDDPVTRGEMAKLLERAMRGTGGWEPWRGAFARTLIVNPKVDAADPLVSGQRLVDLVAEITDASANNPYLVHLEPGIYDLAGASLTLKPWVTIEGSGEGATLIRSARNGAVIAGEDDAELRLLTVENPGSGSASYALDIAGDAVRLYRVAAYAHGGAGSNVGIANADTGAILTEVTTIATASGAASAAGVSIGGAARLTRVDAQVSSAAGGRGITAFAGSPVIEDSTAIVLGGTPVYAFNVETGATATLRRVTGTASSATGGAQAAGLHLLDGNATAYDSTFFGSAATSYGLWAERISGSHTVNAHGSRFLGGTTVRGASSYTIQIGDGQLSGGALSSNGATVTCYGAYDENFQNAGGVTACP